MYDFANSGYTTVVLTAIYSAYFVGVVARANGADSGTATLLWTLAMGVANFLVLASAPVIGAIADHRAWKKRFLLVTTVGCVGFTTALGFAGPGDIGAAMLLVILASVMFASGENLIAVVSTRDRAPKRHGAYFRLRLDARLYRRVAGAGFVSVVHRLGRGSGPKRGAVRAGDALDHRRRFCTGSTADVSLVA